MKKVLYLVAILGLTTSSLFAQLTMNNAVTPTDLVNNYLLGSGVTATNITYNGSPIARSAFTCTGTCNLGMGAGILLSTGQATTAPAGFFHNTILGTPGDPQLDSIIDPRLTQDATILEFDFYVASDSLKFEYVFASEEYNDYAAGNPPSAYNDVFAFFISGPGIVGQQNLAVVPGTTTPVSINTINNGYSAGVSSGPCTNCQYYIDNVNGPSVYFDGFTTVLTAKTAVQPCQTYHIKLAIADATDGAFDSGVFLKAGSFTSFGQINVFANGVAQPDNGTVYACTGTSVQLCLNPAQNYNWVTGETTQCITVNEQNIVPGGVYNAAVFSPANNCFVFTSNLSVQFITPSATITPSGPLNLCPGNNVTLTANQGNTYLWSNGATSQSISVGTAGTYTVTVSNGPNCSAVSTPVTVTVGNATAQITGVLSLCNGANTTLTANAGLSYLWNNGAVTQNINVAAAGAYTVTVTQAGGCTATATVNVAVNANPVPAIAGTLSFCQGDNTVLDAGPGYTTYLWSNGLVTPTVNVTTGGTYTVTVTNAAGCSASTSVAVVANPLPVPAITGVTAFCTGNNSTLNAGPGYSQYLWSNGDITQTTNVSTGGNYAVTVTNNNGCSATTSTLVTVNPLPNPNITGIFAFCQGSNTVLSAGPGFVSYLWNNGTAAQNLTVSTANTYTVTVTNANGCSNTDSQVITVNPNPVPAISGTLSICQGTNTTLSATPGFTSYLWSTGGVAANLNVNTSGPYAVTVTDANNCTGTTAVNVTVNALPVPAITGVTAFCQGGNSNLNAGGGFSSYLWNTGAITQTINVTTPGSYVVTVTNAAGCSASTSTPVTVNALPVPNITGPASVCIGNTATLNAGGGYASYLWNTGATTPTISATNAGNYTVTVSSAAGCSGSDNTSLTVNPLPVPVITGVTTICQGASTTLDAGAGYQSYVWSTGSTAQTINTGNAGVVTVTVTDMNGCVAPASSNVTVNALPVPVIAGDFEFCQGQSSTLDAGAGFTSYLWNTGAVTRSINVNTGGNYTVTVTAANNCSGIDSELIVVRNNPAPVINGDLTICQGDATTLNAGGGYSSYLWNNGATTQTIPVSGAGNYTVTVSSAYGCIGSTSATTVVNQLPVPVITGVTTICQGTSTSFDAGAGYAAYLWSNGSTSQTIAPGTAGVYTVTVTDNNTCSNSDNINLAVNALPVPAITGTTAFCQGDNSNLNAGPGFSNYLWSDGSTSQVINVTTAGNYSVTVTDANGCSANTSSAITVHPNPTPVIQGGTGICQGTSTTLNVPGNYATYQWNTGEITPSISVNAAGNFTVTVSSAFGCVGSSATAMIINPLPTPVISGVTTVCQGATTVFDVGAGYSSYVWSSGSSSQTISPGVAGIYSVTVTDANGCQNNTSISLTVNPLPTPSITGDFILCQGDNSIINAGAGYTSYLWSDGTTAQVINVNTAGNYSVTVTDGNGCSASTSSAIIVNPLPVPSITGINAICQGTTTTFNAGNYVAYAWSNGETTPDITIGTAGTYLVTVTDVNGCINSTSETLTVYDLPTATISGVSEVCLGGSSSIILTFNGEAPFSAAYTNGTIVSPYNTAALSGVINVTPQVTTTYNLLTISDAHCAGTVNGTAMVTVNPLPEPLISGDLAICDGESTTLNASPGFTSYNWSNSNSQPSVVTGIGGIYTVTVIDANGCEGTSPAVNLVVNAVPVVAFTNDTSLTCAVPQINFTNLSQYVPGSTFEWTFGDGSVSAAANPSHLYFAPGNYPVSLEITTPAGCVSNTSSQVDIMFFPLPEADFVTAPGITNVFNGKVDFVDRSDYAVSWLWEFGDGAKSAEQNPFHYYNEVGDYRVALTVTNIAGCIDRYEDVVVINPFYIPNAFSPNGDGVNDLFYYSGYDLDVANYNMKIFNRWGQLVFTGEDENDNWNGSTLDGVTAPQGTYVYRLQVKTKGGKEYVFDGHVNLIR